MLIIMIGHTSYQPCMSDLLLNKYHQYMNDINPLADQIYRYLNFNEIDTYVQSANSADIPAINIVNPL